MVRNDLANLYKCNPTSFTKNYLRIAFYKRDKSLKISLLSFRTPESPKLVQVFSSEGEFVTLCPREAHRTRSKTENIFTKF